MGRDRHGKLGRDARRRGVGNGRKSCEAGCAGKQKDRDSDSWIDPKCPRQRHGPHTCQGLKPALVFFLIICARLSRETSLEGSAMCEIPKGVIVAREQDVEFLPPDGAYLDGRYLSAIRSPSLGRILARLCPNSSEWARFKQRDLVLVVRGLAPRSVLRSSSRQECNGADNPQVIIRRTQAGHPCQNTSMCTRA